MKLITVNFNSIWNQIIDQQKKQTPILQKKEFKTLSFLFNIYLKKKDLLLKNIKFSALKAF